MTPRWSWSKTREARFLLGVAVILALVWGDRLFQLGDNVVGCIVSGIGGLLLGLLAEVHE